MGTSPPYWSLDPPSVSSCHIALADIKDAITLHFLFSVHDRFQKTWKQSVCCAWPCVYHFFCSFIPNAHIFWLSPFCLKNFNNNNSFKRTGLLATDSLSCPSSGYSLFPHSSGLLLLHIQFWLC